MVDNFMNKVLEKDLVQYVKNSNWAIKGLVVRLLQDNLTDNDSKQLADLLGDSHRKDHRTPEEMALNIALAWAVEDAIKDRLIKLGIKTENSGTDKTRGFGKYVANIPDLVSKTASGEKYTEVVMGYTGRERTSGVALRDNKYENLLEYNSMLVGIDLYNEKMFVVTDLKNKKVGEKAYNGGFGKMTRPLMLSDKDFFSYTDGFKKLAEALKK